MGKKNRTGNTESKKPLIGNVTGFKQLGKPLTVLYASYPTDIIKNVYDLNREDGEFTALPVHPVMFTDYNDLTAEPNKSLGIIILSDPQKIIPQGKGWVFEKTVETLPFLVGETLWWRNAKIGHLLDEDPEIKTTTAEVANFYSTRFPEWEQIYKIEQIIDITGWSDSLNILLDKKIETITKQYQH